MFTFFFVENVFDKLLERLSVCPALRLSIGSCDGTRVQKSHSVRVCRQDYRVFFYRTVKRGWHFAMKSLKIIYCSLPVVWRGSPFYGA